jgi:hypothetical protein
MDLSFTKSLLGKFDDEFQFAFARTIQIGGAERDVLRGMSELGIANWRELTPANRHRFLSMLDTEVKRDTGYVMNIAVRHSRKYIPLSTSSGKGRCRQILSLAPAFLSRRSL